MKRLAIPPAKRQWHRAQTIPEYALVITFMAIFIIGTISALGGDLTSALTMFANKLTQIVSQVTS